MELPIKGETYRTGKLDARKQFHVARRLGPVLVARMQGMTAMAAAFGAMGKPPAAQVAAAPATAADAAAPAPADKPVPDNVLVAGFLPVAQAIAKISDADADYVLTTCLSVCERQVGGSWAPVQAANGKLMYEDIDMGGMMALVEAVVKENIGDFFPVPPGNTKK